MLKVLIIALFCTVVVLASSNQCTSVCQSTVGAYCGVNGTVTYTCGYGFWCNATQCSAVVAAGSSCPIGFLGCPAGTSCLPHPAYPNYACVNATVGPGHACSSDADCVYANGPSNCTNGVCFGLPDGAACTLSQLGLSVCNAGLWCNGTGCTPQGGQDDDCSGGPYSYYECGTPFSCIDTFCVGFEQEEGDDCTSIFNCEEGLYCTSYTGGTCASPAASSGNACNVSTTTTDCNAGESCVCNSCVAPSVYPDGFGDAFIAYEQCISNQSIACQQVVPVGCSACYEAWCDFILISGELSEGISAACPYSPAAIQLVEQCLASATTASSTTATTGSATATATTGSATTSASATTNAVTTGAVTTGVTATTAKTVTTSGSATTGAAATSSGQSTTAGTTSGAATATSSGKTSTAATATTGSSTTSASTSVVASSLFAFAVVFALLF